MRKSRAEQHLDAALQQEEILRSLMPGDPYERLARQNIEYYLAEAVEHERKGQ